MRPSVYVFVCSLVLGLLMSAMAGVALAQSQATAADLTGVVKDETDAVIPGATVTVRNPQTNFERVSTTDESGVYKILAIPPGTYQVITEAAGFSRQVNENVVLTLGQAARLDLGLTIASGTEEIIVTAAPEVVETTKTAVTQTIDQQRIDNLPINGRSFLNFSLTNSQIGRDNSPPLGPAPTTGLNFGGQRARSNLVQVDGADNIDNSVNAAKATVSQEAVQEFQVVMNSFAAEFGRTAGGVVNIVTKSGTNEYHGNVFGFIRHRSIQARNALAFPPAGANRKPAFTRGQYGFTLGGPLQKDKTFFFISLDQTQRHESGFSQIGLDSTIFQLTPAQQAFIAANPGLIGTQYAALAISGAAVARTGFDPVMGRRAFITSGVPIPAAFRPLSGAQNVYPVSDEFTFYSAKLDHQLNPNNRLTARFNFTPATTTGIQSSGQNQPFGLNDVSRTGLSAFRDSAFVVQLLTTIGSTKINDFLFNFGRRGTLYTSGSDVSLNIPGAGFFGRDPFSPVDRVEKRYEFKDNFTFAKGDHVAKFGVDINYIRINPARFELNFSGLYSFGEIPAGAISPFFAAAGAPVFTTVQAYGLGLPQLFVQGFGRSTSKVINKTFGFYGQDSWKIRPNITFNYGVRYDVELTPIYKPVPLVTDTLQLSAQQLDDAERFFNIVQGIPRDKNNVAPRVAIAWDPKGDGKTVIRAAYGLFFDHPLLALAFNSDIADSSQSPQFISIAGSPAPTASLNATQIFQGTVIPGVTPGLDRGAIYLPGESRFNPFAAQPGFGSIPPILFPVDRSFVYAYTNQVNLSIERELVRDVSLNLTYIFTGGRHLPHPVDRNVPNAKLVLQASPTGTPTPALIAFNFFRPSGPNPAIIRTALPIPYGPLSVQESSSSSVYHAISANITKRFSRNFQLLGSYTYSKTIDDSTDLQSLLQPQDNNRPGDERGLSSFDQRHRFVFSGIFKTPYDQSSSSGLKKLLANFTVAPIIELSSGRPFNILTGTDTNIDQSSGTDRPNVDPNGNLSLPRLGTTGNLGRNAGIGPGFASVDLRVARNLPIGERVKIDFIAECFNLFNRVNVSTVNNNFRFVTFDDDRFKSQPTAVFDPRQFQFAIKIAF
jgi:hypothetical protein